MPAGRPEKEIDIEEVEKLASRGLTEGQIAECLGVDQATITRRKKKYAEFRKAISRGKAIGIKAITNSLFAQAEKGNTSATIFYLKNRDRENWRDRWPEDEPGETNVTIHINKNDRD